MTLDFLTFDFRTLDIPTTHCTYMLLHIIKNKRMNKKIFISIKETIFKLSEDLDKVEVIGLYFYRLDY